MTAKKKNDGKLLERIVADMCENIEGAKVSRNVKLKGKLSGRKRQIDVLIEGKYGAFDVMIEVEAKDYKKAVGIKTVESFISKVKDTGADLGVMVSSHGFGKGAIERARADNIQLFQAVSDELKNSNLFIPLRMVIYEIDRWQVGFKHRTSGEHYIPPLQNVRILRDGVEYNLKQLLVHSWNTEKIRKQLGSQKIIFDAVTMIDTTNRPNVQYCELEMTVSLKARYYLRVFPAKFLLNAENGKKNYEISVPIFSDQQRMEEEWKGYSSMEELNKAADIENQPQDVRELIVIPHYSLPIEDITFTP